jgi:hypothetical protein
LLHLLFKPQIMNSAFLANSPLNEELAILRESYQSMIKTLFGVLTNVNHSNHIASASLGDSSLFKDQQNTPANTLARVMPIFLQVATEDDLVCISQQLFISSHYHTAMIILDALVDRCCLSSPKKAIRAQFLSVLCRLQLGRVEGATRLLSAMNQQHIVDLLTNYRVKQRLATLLLQRGDYLSAAELVQELELLPSIDDPHVKRTTTILNSALQIISNPPAESTDSTLFQSDQLIFAAIDSVRFSRDGLYLSLSGWLIDPSNKIDSIIIRLGLSLIIVSFSSIEFSIRSDLASFLGELQLPADYKAGLQYRLALAAEEPIKLTDSLSASVSFVDRLGTCWHVGCVATLCEPDYSDVIPLLSPWLANAVPAVSTGYWDI